MMTTIQTIRRTAAAMACVCSFTLFNAGAQSPVAVGGGSIASFPPAYKAKTTESNKGFNATAMLSRRIYADEVPSSSYVDGLEAPGRPIPTNDWWTDIINSRFSGSLWSYPAMLKTSEGGLTVCWPSYWADQGKEIKSRSSVTVSARDYRADAAIAADWHDWDVVFRMPAREGDGEMRITAVHGMPFTWIEFSGLSPRVEFSAAPEILEERKGLASVRVGTDLYGLYFPAEASWHLSEGRLLFDDEAQWLVVALLRSEADLEAFAPYAVSVPRSTRVEWSYDESTAAVASQWTVEAENLRNSSGEAPVMQGFLPHVYKHMLPGNTLSFADESGYQTPRGRMKMAVSPAGSFRYAYRFSGMLPMYAAPAEGEGFDPDVMKNLLADYAAGGSFGGDTYWGGKGLTQMAMNMWFAKLTGNDEEYAASRRKLREAFENWLTYTPGEDTFFFSYYPRWGGMLGFDVSYDSDAFNDHHFHFGYFTYAAALLCMEDADFADRYGDLLRLIAKDYANWDREDPRFPFMRTLDPWNGHSWAGGLGDAGNDNGNGQESSSEAMQAWGGLYLLGVALGDREMRDAGIWGWSTEARATREYWFDIDAPRSANAGGRKSWPGKNGREGNYDYDEYPYAYNSNITGKGIGWWTWFGGDPLYMHGIQWMPASPALDYLSWDPDFAAWALDDMLSGANSSYSHSWFEATSNSDGGAAIEPLAANDWGSVALTYLQRSNPRQAADIFDEALRRGLHIASAVSTSHISYYLIHNHLYYGDPDFSIHADIPTAQVNVKDGVYTYTVYNPGAEDRVVGFYDASGRLVKSVKAPAGRLVAVSADPEPAAIEYEIDGGVIVPPGKSASLKARVVDQYGAGMDDEVIFTLSEGAPASLSSGMLRINTDARLGSVFSVIFSSGSLSSSVQITVNELPVGVQAVITDLPKYNEKSAGVSPRFVVTDQYGSVGSPDDTQWRVTDHAGTSTAASLPLEFAKAGKYTVAASSPSLDITAEAQVIVTPSLPLISEGADVAASSAENAGTMPGGVNDGDTATRWGSAHSDDEWVMVDLGEDCFVSRVSILWEAAYGSRYLLQVAPDRCAMTDLSVSYAGQQKSVRVPAESEWTTVADVNNNSAGLRSDLLNAEGRYVRMKGMARGSVYGYSIYEMGVYGIRPSATEGAVLGIDFSLPATLDCGEAFTLEPELFDYEGNLVEGAAVSWGSDRQARFAGNVFTPLASGMHTLTASLPGGVSSEGSVFVNDVERPVAVEFERDSYMVVAGESVYVPFTVTNQYMAPYRGSLDSLPVVVTDDAGAPAANAHYDRVAMNFSASTAGRYYIEIGQLGRILVEVKELGEINLALDRPAAASSANGGNTAARAFDGNMDTRWESEWADGQYLEVDLGEYYLIDRAVIVWEGAYASNYSLAVSGNGEDWFEFYARPNCKGGTEALSFGPVPARYVRVNCLTRALSAYGFSIKELEIYGVGKLDDKGSSAPTVGRFEVSTGNGSILAQASASGSDVVLLSMSVHDSAGRVVDSKRVAVESGEEWEVEFTGLPTGRYDVVLTASDIFGNASEEVKEGVPVVYSIVGINLALGRQAFASSVENGGLAATNAVDGNLDSRWGSQFNDDEWIVVDLGMAYVITDVKIHWNNPAYATHFSVALSTTGADDDFREVHRCEGYVHTGGAYHAALEGEDYGRYVKITGHKRATGYGTSINEIEIYGDDFTVVVDSVWDSDGPVEYFNLQGIRLAAPVPGQPVIIRTSSGTLKTLIP